MPIDNLNGVNVNTVNVNKFAVLQTSLTSHYKGFKPIKMHKLAL